MNSAIGPIPDELTKHFDRLEEELRADGSLTDPGWRDALRTVPRHLFIPNRAWIYQGIEAVEIDRDHDPLPWWEAVYDHKTVIVTQYNDGAAGPDQPGATPSSSCPEPNLQIEMLEALAVAAGLNVLEIGTGTGWNAALLAHRLGDQQVVTVEVDPDVLRQARISLARSGHRPLTVAGDGTHGYPSKGPYDRVIATCAVHTIPDAWITQTRPGGIILTPWTPLASRSGDLLARLQVREDGTASGPFVEGTGFMRLRQQRRPADLPRPDVSDDPPAGTVTSTTAVDPVALLFRSKITAFLAQLGLGGGRYGITRRQGAEETIVWLSDPTGGSWARVFSPVPFQATPPSGTRFAVEQVGPRRLWDELQTIHDWWQDAGRPDYQRFGLTAGPWGQTVWLDDPAQPVFELPTPETPTFVGVTG